MMRWKNILVLAAIFLLGVVAGFGLGNAFGGNSYNAQLEQKVTDLESRYQTVNDNYLTLAREYNKLFTLKAPAVADVVPQAPSASDTTTAPAAAKPTPTTAAKATIAPTTASAKPTVAPTGGASTTGAKIKADFKALAIDGTGPLEGPPPLMVDFTDLSTGNITSWKWDFGDGQTSTEQNPQHRFNTCPGDTKTCTIKLTVCGPDGCVTATKPDYLLVSESCSGC